MPISSSRNIMCSVRSGRFRSWPTRTPLSTPLRRREPPPWEARAGRFSSPVAVMTKPVTVRPRFSALHKSGAAGPNPSGLIYGPTPFWWPILPSPPTGAYFILFPTTAAGREVKTSGWLRRAVASSGIPKTWEVRSTPPEMRCFPLCATTESFISHRTTTRVWEGLISSGL